MIRIISCALLSAFLFTTISAPYAYSQGLPASRKERVPPSRLGGSGGAGETGFFPFSHLKHQYVKNLKKLSQTSDKALKKQIDQVIDTIENRLIFSPPFERSNKRYVHGRYLGDRSQVAFLIEYAKTTPPIYDFSRNENPLRKNFKTAMGTLRLSPGSFSEETVPLFLVQQFAPALMNDDNKDFRVQAIVITAEQEDSSESKETDDETNIRNTFLNKLESAFDEEYQDYKESLKKLLIASQENAAFLYEKLPALKIAFKENFEDFWPYFFKLGIIAKEHTPFLFSALLIFRKLIREDKDLDPKDFHSIGRQLISIFISINRTIKISLFLEKIGVLYKLGAIQSGQDLKLLGDMIHLQPQKAYYLLKDFLIPGIKSKVIFTPLTEEKDLLIEFLYKIPLLAFQIYALYKDERGQIDHWINKCESLHTAIIYGTVTNQEEADSLFPIVLQHVYPALTDTNPLSYADVYNKALDYVKFPEPFKPAEHLEQKLILLPKIRTTLKKGKNLFTLNSPILSLVFKLPYGNSKNSAYKPIIIQLTKRKSHALNKITMEIPQTWSDGTSDYYDGTGWDDPNFMHAVFFDEKDIAQGGMYLWIIELNNGERALTWFNMNPTMELLSHVDTEELLNRVIAHLWDIAHALKIKQVLIPTSPHIQSVRPEIQKAIESKGYDTQNLTRPYNFGVYNYYSFSKAYVVPDTESDTAFGLLPFWPQEWVQNYPKLPAIFENMFFQGFLMGVVSLFVSAFSGYNLGLLLLYTGIGNSLLFALLHFKVYYDLQKSPEKPRKFSHRLSLLGLGLVASGLFTASLLGFNALFGHHWILGTGIGIAIGLSLAALFHWGWNRLAPKYGVPLGMIGNEYDKKDKKEENSEEESANLEKEIDEFVKSYPRLTSSLNIEFIRTHFSDLQKLGLAVGESCKKSFLENSLPKFIDAFGLEKFNDSWKEFLRLGIAIGSNAYPLFRYFSILLDVLITDKEELSPIVDDLIQLNKTAGEKSKLLFGFELPKLIKSFSKAKEFKKYWEYLVKWGVIAGEQSADLFEIIPAILQYGNLIQNPEDFNLLCSRILNISQAPLSLHKIKSLCNLGAIQSNDDLLFLIDLIRWQQHKSFKMLKDFLIPAIQNKIISIPASHDKKWIIKFLKKSPYHAMGLYELYKQKDSDAMDQLIVSCNVLSNAIMHGYVSERQEKDPLFSMMLKHAFSGSHYDLYEERQDRDNHIKSLFPSEHLPFLRSGLILLERKGAIKKSKDVFNAIPSVLSMICEREYGSQKKTKFFPLKLVLSKKRVHALTEISRDVPWDNSNLWNNDYFMNVILFDEEGIAQGGMFMLIINEEDVRYLSVFRIDLSPSVLLLVRAEDFYKKMIAYAWDAAHALKIKEIIIPVDRNVQSMNPEIRQVIVSQHYKQKELMQTYYLDSETDDYPFQEVYEVPDPDSNVNLSQINNNNSPNNNSNNPNNNNADDNAENDDQDFLNEKKRKSETDSYSDSSKRTRSQSGNVNQDQRSDYGGKVNSDETLHGIQEIQKIIGGGPEDMIYDGLNASIPLKTAKDRQAAYQTFELIRMQQ